MNLIFPSGLKCSQKIAPLIREGSESDEREHFQPNLILIKVEASQHSGEELPMARCADKLMLMSSTVEGGVLPVTMQS